MEILSHFHWGISKGCNFLEGLWYSILAFWQAKHAYTKPQKALNPQEGEIMKLEDKHLRCYFTLKFVVKIRKPACNENHSNKGRSRHQSKRSKVLTHTLQCGKWRHELWPQSTERSRFAHVPKCDSDEHELEWEQLRTRTRTPTLSISLTLLPLLWDSLSICHHHN